jgi:predicted permease
LDAIIVGMFWQHLRYAVRVLGKDRGFTSVAVISIALGIGANTAIFTLINALLLRSLPVREPQALVELSAVRRDAKTPLSLPMFREVEMGQTVFSGVTGWIGGGVVRVEVNGSFSQGRVSAVTGDYYTVLGVPPLFGRLITKEDANTGSGSPSQVAVLGYEFWQSRLGAAPDILGEQIHIEGQPFTIVGVTRRWFTGMMPGEPADITIPMMAFGLIQSNTFKVDDRSLLWLSVTGRLKDGVTIAQARAQLESFWPEVLEATASTQEPGPRRDAFLSMGLDVAPAATGIAVDLRSRFTRPLVVLLGIVGMILLVACVNLASLMLARAAARSHEMSVRVALGANRWVLARQLLTESLALSFSGALLGLALAYWGSRLLVTMMTQDYFQPVTLDLRPDSRVISVTLFTAVLTGILFGLAPVWRASREDPISVLQQGGRGMVGGAGRLGNALLIAQVGLSFMLLLGAGLLMRSFQKLSSVDLGFGKENLLEVGLSPTPGGYQNLDMKSYRRQLIEHISAVPGAGSVSYSSVLVPGGRGWREAVSPTSADSAFANVTARAAMVTPGFFPTLGLRLLGGRDFDWSDDEQHPPLAIVSRSLAERLFLDGDAIGQRIRFGVMPEFQTLEIVGIADNARLFDLREAASYVVYLPYQQHSKMAQYGGLLIRASGATDALVRGAGAEIESLGHEYAFRTRTVAQVTDQILVPERVTAWLSSFFGGLALLLTCVGLYGLMSYTVTGRTREIGIRLALGAQRGEVLRGVLREATVLALSGVAIGIPSALAASRLVTSMLFGISPGDLSTMAAVTLLLVVVALIAGSVPARRASAIDPIVALRTE